MSPCVGKIPWYNPKITQIRILRKTFQMSKRLRTFPFVFLWMEVIIHIIDSLALVCPPTRPSIELCWAMSLSATDVVISCPIDGNKTSKSTSVGHGRAPRQVESIMIIFPSKEHPCLTPITCNYTVRKQLPTLLVGALLGFLWNRP